jgi:hypothetical protein
VRKCKVDGTREGFERFHVLGMEVERSVVTGRLAGEILADEGVDGFVPRRGWRGVVERGTEEWRESEAGMGICVTCVGPRMGCLAERVDSFVGVEVRPLIGGPSSPKFCRWCRLNSSFM